MLAQLRTRPSFPACLPYKPAAAAPIDRWLATHAVDQLAADTLQASAVILGSWCAAGLASLVVLGGLVSAPRLTLVLSMASILLITFSGAAMLLPHGTHILAAARAPRNGRRRSTGARRFQGSCSSRLGGRRVQRSGCSYSLSGSALVMHRLPPPFSPLLRGRCVTYLSCSSSHCTSSSPSARR